MLDIDTNKQGLIVYDGLDSSNYGIVVGRAPSFDKPAIKGSSVSVPGRNGAVLFQEDAYEDIPRSYPIWIAEKGLDTLAKRVSDFTNALYTKRGYLELTDNFEPDIFRLAYFPGGQNFSNELTMYGESTLQFICRPERFLKTGATAIEVTDGYTLKNPTNFKAKPLIYIQTASEETIEISIGGKTIVAECEDYLYIDCEKMNAYRLASENKNSEISGDFPVILPGSNTIGIDGNVTKVKITPRYYFI